MALELAGDVAAVYETSDGQTKRGYNLAFFKKLYVLPEWDDQGQPAATIDRAELTDPYAVLLADDLAQGVLAEAEAIASGSTNSEDGPEGPSSISSTAVSYFEVMTEREGFEPSKDVAALNGFRDRPVQPLRHLSRMSPTARREAPRVPGGRAGRPCGPA